MNKWMKRFAFYALMFGAVAGASYWINQIVLFHVAAILALLSAGVALGSYGDDDDN